MDTWWRKLGRPALLGFVVGLLVMSGLALIVPLSRAPAPAAPH